MVLDVECADLHERVAHVLKELGSRLQVVEIPKRKGLDHDHWKFGNNHRFRDGRNFNKCWCDRAGRSVYNLGHFRGLCAVDCVRVGVGMCRYTGCECCNSGYDEGL